MPGFGGSGLASELENLQRLEELERRQRLMNAAVGGGSGLGPAPAGSVAGGQNPMDSSGGIRGSVLREELMQGQHLHRPSTPWKLDRELHSPDWIGQSRKESHRSFSLVAYSEFLDPLVLGV